eukprot:TRINITY_DN1196_c0_g1_i2.p1 TRINITY_DN1196_c0_g1~~TRINITY_DN1196_c0_g1_i2.p1  ORF type:complete len:392 (-),score=47.94 TRINITY_DN1196_c0_g1_i2:24-1199(-)
MLLCITSCFSDSQKKDSVIDQESEKTENGNVAVNDVGLHNYIESPVNFYMDMESPPIIIPCEGFRIELGGLPTNVDKVELENKERNSLFYKEHIFEKEHFNLIGGTPESPVIVSLCLKDENGYYKTLTRTKKEDYPISIPAHISRPKILKALSKEYLPEILSNLKLKEIKNELICQRLLHMEDRLLIKSYKFGIVYCKEGQTHEDLMFSNVNPSKEFQKFLSLLGDTVVLKGFQMYRGGLDTESNTTGTQSLFTNFNGFQIMYHVSTHLPHTPNNPQQLERKRHIGNDVVVIVFQDGPTHFTPTTITSKFNHVYIVVQYDKEASSCGTPHYRLGVASKRGVVPHRPILPANPVFPHSPEFREFLLTKCLDYLLISFSHLLWFCLSYQQIRP